MQGKMPKENRVWLTGRLVYDPILRYSRTRNKRVCDFTIASERKYKDQKGDWQKEVIFMPIAVWGVLAEDCNNHLKKGSPVFVEGRLRSRIWTDKNEITHKILEILCKKIAFLENIVEKDEKDEPTEPEAELLGGD